MELHMQKSLGHGGREEGGVEGNSRRHRGLTDYDRP